MNLGKLTLLALASAMLASTAFGQATRTWISGVGDDVNPCSRTAPCKTFQGAISKTAAGGEINVLDPGGFGAVTITKSITLLAQGMPAGVLVSGTNGIVISNNSGSTMNVTIRGLDIDGLNTGLSGIFITGNSPTNVHLEQDIIYGFSNGVNVNAGTPANVTISSTRISESTNGILADGSSSTVNVSVIGSEVHNTTTGVSLVGAAKFNVKNSDLSQNTTGINLADSSSGTLDTNTVAFCTTGVNVATSGATVRLTNNTITDNGTGLATVPGGNIVSFGNNRTKGNTANGSPTATLVQN